jgi:ribosomal protein S4
MRPDVPILTLPADTMALSLVGALHKSGLVRSLSEGHRLIEQGAVEVDGHVISEPSVKLVADKTFTVRVHRREVVIKVIP